MDAPGILGHPDSAGERAGETEPDIAVPVRRIVPVAVCRAQIPWIVVPGAPAQDTERGRPGMWMSPSRGDRFRQ